MKAVVSKSGEEREEGRGRRGLLTDDNSVGAILQLSPILCSIKKRPSVFYSRKIIMRLMANIILPTGGCVPRAPPAPSL